MYSYGDGYASHKTDRQEQFERKESEGMSDWQLFTSSAIGLNVIASGGNVSSSSPSTVTVSPPTADGSGADSVCWGKCSQWLFERRSYILNKVALSVVRDFGVQLPIRKGARVSTLKVWNISCIHICGTFLCCEIDKYLFDKCTEWCLQSWGTFVSSCIVRLG